MQSLKECNPMLVTDELSQKVTRESDVHPMNVSESIFVTVDGIEICLIDVQY